MALKMKASSGGGDFVLVPAGNHAAVLVAIVELGTHYEEFQGKGKDTEKVYLVWELTDEEKDGGGHYFIGREYTMSFNEKAGLRKMVEAWRGSGFANDEEFDLTKLLGQGCQLNVAHKPSGDKKYANVAGASKPMKGVKIPPATVKPFIYEINSGEDAPGQEWLPFIYGASVKDKIGQSAEKKGGGADRPRSETGSNGYQSNDGEADSQEDDIPF